MSASMTPSRTRSDWSTVATGDGGSIRDTGLVPGTRPIMLTKGTPLLSRSVSAKPTTERTSSMTQHDDAQRRAVANRDEDRGRLRSPRFATCVHAPGDGNLDPPGPA